MYRAWYPAGVLSMSAVVGTGGGEPGDQAKGRDLFYRKQEAGSQGA